MMGQGLAHQGLTAAVRIDNLDRHQGYGSARRPPEGEFGTEKRMAEKVEIAVETHVGMVRAENQDHFCVLPAKGSADEMSKGHLVVVADGMGGHTGGSIASQTTTGAILEAFDSSKMETMRDLLEESVLASNEAVKAKQQKNIQLKDMGTTCVAALFRGSALMVAHLGDSRCYMHRGDQNEQVTRDHTYLNELIDIGLLTEEQAEGHPDKNIITRCVGMSTNLEIDFNRRTLEPGDIISICSDGLSNFVSMDECGEVVRELAPKEACLKLIEMANERGGDDNITVAVILIHELPPEDKDLLRRDEEQMLLCNAKMTPIIKRDDLNLDDSEADTAKGHPRPNTSNRKSEQTGRYDVAFLEPGETSKVNLTAETVTGLGQNSSNATAGWYWVIGAEVLLLIVLQMMIGQY
ncbi:MAG: serine/threonine protein phosphatase PrpC [Planctomycetota bacterium]|jgi:serine/threonine protein phosphatase PrpC